MIPEYDRLKLQVHCERFSSEPEGKYYVAVEARINGILVTTWEDMPVDMDALKASSVCDGEYYVWNCTCGYPGCAGLESGIRIAHKADTVTWRNNPPPLGNFADLVFDKAAYVQEIQTTMKEMALQAKIHRELGAEVEFLLRSEEELFWRPEDREWTKDLPAFARKPTQKKGKR